MADLRSIEAYWQEGLPKIEVLVDQRMLPYLTRIRTFHEQWGIKRNALEIGVYHGKFLIDISYLLSQGKKCVSIDVFEDQEKNIDHAGVGDYTMT